MLFHMRACVCTWPACDLAPQLKKEGKEKRQTGQKLYDTFLYTS